MYSVLKYNSPVLGTTLVLVKHHTDVGSDVEQQGGEDEEPDEPLQQGDDVKFVVLVEHNPDLFDNDSNECRSLS